MGDVLPVEVGGQVRDLTIVGSYQDITNGGTTAKSELGTEDDDVMWSCMVGLELSPGVDRPQLVRLRLTTMGFVFQHVHLLKNLCLLDNVVLPAYLAPRQELNERAMALMERTGVAELAQRDVSEASGGQLQQVGICRALITDPAILFCDEPAGALDSTAAAEVMDIIGTLNTEGTTVMLVTHDAMIAARTERLLYMVDGRIVGDRHQGRYEGGRYEGGRYEGGRYEGGRYEGGRYEGVATTAPPSTVATPR